MYKLWNFLLKNVDVNLMFFFIACAASPIPRFWDWFGSGTENSTIYAKSIAVSLVIARTGEYRFTFSNSFMEERRPI